MIRDKQKRVNPVDEQNETEDNVISVLPTGGESSLRWHSEKEVTYFGIQVGCAVQTQFGTGSVKSIPKNQDDSLVVSLDKWTLADGKSPLVFFRIPRSSPVDLSSDIDIEHKFFEAHGIQNTRSARAKQILQDDRDFMLDASPSFVLAAGKAVSGMLASNVADYVEFRTVEGLFWLEDGELSRVPCSKNDVFGTKLLAPMEKRRLMKFIQLSMDYATQLSAAEELLQQSSGGNNANNSNPAETSIRDSEQPPEAEVQSLNERHLNQGRSLARPQNKGVSKEELQVLQKCMEEGMNFDDFLGQQQKLSPKLRAIIRYALAWERDASSTSLSRGMANLRHHLQSLGRFGNTGFIFPMYGTGELSQAFCRSAAVFGATYLLRRPLIGIRISDNETEGVIIAGDESESCPKISRVRKDIESPTVIVPATSVPSLKEVIRTRPRLKILRRISILSGKLLQSAHGDRHVIFIPPQSIGNSRAIHCLTLDDTVHVAPRGCAVMHLTTTVDSDTEGGDTILARAARDIITASQVEVDEVYHATFSHDFISTDSTKEPPKGIYLCHHNGQVLTADVAFEQAQSIFSKICPGMEFLGISHELDSCIKERAAERGYNDEERLMLESALDMIGKTIGNDGGP
eukprot:scaffold10571_cov154-Cylindrotheca_fusiformis.AAC.6